MDHEGLSVPEFILNSLTSKSLAAYIHTFKIRCNVNTSEIYQHV